MKMEEPGAFGCRVFFCFFFWAWARLRPRGCARRATSQEPAGTTLGATPAATRQGRAAKSGRLSIALRAGSGCEWRFPIRPPVSAETAGPPRPAPCGLFPLAALAYGYRPRGWYPPTLPSTEGVDGRAPL